MTAVGGTFSVGGTFDLADLGPSDDHGASFRFEQGTLQNTGTTFELARRTTRWGPAS